MLRRPTILSISILAAGLVIVSACSLVSSSSQAAPTSSLSLGRPTASSRASVPLPSPTEACPLPNLPHTNPNLERLLPPDVGGVCLTKFSDTLAWYMDNFSGGEDKLYTPWLANLGKTPDAVSIAVGADFTQSVNFAIKGIQVSGADDSSLMSGFADTAKAAGWPVELKSGTSLPKTVYEITDPAAKEAGKIAVGYVWASHSVLYTIVTDDANLLVEGLIKAP